jgi:hypothetical protein
MTSTPCFSEPPSEHRVFLVGGWYRAAALAEALANCWFPIETAPKDGTDILGWDGRQYLIIHGQRHSAQWLDDEGVPRRSVTHWLPLARPAARP